MQGQYANWLKITCCNSPSTKHGSFYKLQAVGIIGRQTIKSTIYIYLGVLVGFLVRAQLFPEFLSEAQIGVIALIVSYGSIFAEVAMLGFKHAAIRYFPYFRNQSQGHGGFLSLYLLVISAGFIIFLMLYLLVGELLVHSAETALFDQYYYLCIPLTAGILLFTVMDNYNSVLYNASTGVLLREFGLRLLTLLALIPLIYGLIGFDFFTQIYVGTYLIIALLMVLFVVWRGQCHLNFRFKAIEKNMIRAMAGISVFGFMTGLTNVAILQVNNIMINEFYDEAQTGIYITNFFFATLILLPSRGLNKIAPTLISDAFKNDDIPTIERIQVKSTVNQQLIGTLVYIGLLINLSNVYKILPDSYAIGSWVIVLTGLANVVQMTSGVGSAIIGFSGFYRYNTYLSALQLGLLIILNIVLLPTLGITGAALANLVTLVVLNILKFLVVKRKFGIQPYHRNHLWVLLISLFCLLLNMLIPLQKLFVVDILVRSSLITTVFVTLNYLLKTSPQLNDNINKALRLLRIP